MCSHIQVRMPIRQFFFAALQPGDTILGLSLMEGGHLTHGMPQNISGKWFKTCSYGLDAREEIDYNEMERVACDFRPMCLNLPVIFAHCCLWKQAHLNLFKEGELGNDHANVCKNLRWQVG